MQSTRGSSFVFWMLFWDFDEAGVAVCVVDAFSVLVEVLVVVLSRVVTLIAVGLVGTRRRCSRQAQLRNFYLFVSMSV